MDVFDWPVLRQLKARDPAALGRPALSKRSLELTPRTRTADSVTRSVCPYCAVGCGQHVYVKDGKIIDIEGDPDSPISEGCLCPKGAATFQLVTGTHREQRSCTARPGHGVGAIPLEQAMDMVAERVKRRPGRALGGPTNDDGHPLQRHAGRSPTSAAPRSTTRRTTSSRSCSPPWAIVQIENQARI